MESNPNAPTFLFDDLPLHWQMTRCEKYAFASILEAAKPEVSVEIGTYRGGSLQIIAERSAKVYSIDLSSEPRERLAGRFPNAELLTGDSRRLIPEVLAKIRERKEQLGFVLIDGDHSTEGVKADVEAVLRHAPTRPVYVVFHDSFHPPCRQGILAAAWQECPWVHYVEVDFVPGVFHLEAFDTARPRSMYGGLALALMLPEERSGDLTVHESQRGLFEAVLASSRHVGFRRRLDFLSRVKHRLLGSRPG